MILISLLMVVGCPQPVSTNSPSASSTDGSQSVSYSPVAGEEALEARMGQTTMQVAPETVIATSKSLGEKMQAEIRSGHHSMFSGKILCSTCSGPFIVKIMAFVKPSPTAAVTIEDGGAPQPPTCGVGGHGSDVRFPPIIVDKPGPFEIAFPWHGYPVVIEVHQDSNGDGRPTPGEPFTVLHEGGALMGNEDRSGLVVDMDAAPPMVGDGSAAPVNQGAGEQTSP
ncbi:MAG: hypothetical protein ACPGTU_13270 [Myxococcota bacterium]